MKRLFVIQLFLSIATQFYCVAQEPIVIDAFAGPFPYLYEVVHRISEERGRYMMRSDSQVHNDASEEVQLEFTKGLYRMVGTALPKFGESRKQLKPFKVIIFEFTNGKLNPKYCRKGFNPKALPFYDEVGEYVADFAKEYGFSRIIFYYMYDG